MVTTPLSSIRDMPTELLIGNRKFHESIFRSFHVVEEVKKMLFREDSPETILNFIHDATEKSQKCSKWSNALETHLNPWNLVFDAPETLPAEPQAPEETQTTEGKTANGPTKGNKGE